MIRTLIPVEQFQTRIFHLFDRQWLLLTCGDFASAHFNSMTISWGSLGIMWNKPFVQVVVRPHRYTFEFMQQYDQFTVCAFPAKFNAALDLLGSQSGRDSYKIAESGLTPCPSAKIASPGFEEAELVLECRKIYWQDMDPDHFLDAGIRRHYPQQDYHRIYYGEILAAFATDHFHTEEGEHA